MINAELLSPSASRSSLRRSGVLSGFTIFCDFDGPIMDVSGRYYRTYQLGLEAVQAHYQALGETVNLSPLSQDSFWQLKQDRTPDTEIAMRSGLEESQMAFFLESVRRLVNRDDLLSEDRLQVGVVWALNLLHSNGARLVLVTLRQQHQVMQILRQHQLSHLFSGIWGAADADAAYANHSQHKTELLEQAIARTVHHGYSPMQSCMIGDTEADILAGQAHHIPTLAVTCGIRSQAYLERFAPTYIYSDLLAIAHQLLHRRILERSA